MRRRAQIRQSGVPFNPAVPAEKRNMAYQRGSLKKVRRKQGDSWPLRFRVTREDRSRVGLVRDLPKEQDAWRKVDRLGRRARINSELSSGPVGMWWISAPICAASAIAIVVLPTPGGPTNSQADA